MGGITKTLFGGGGSKSSNQSYGTLLGLLQGNIGQGNNAMGTLGGLLGLGGGGASNAAFNNYLDSTNFNFLKDQGQAGITGSAAAKGVMNSGGTAKALTNYGADLASTKLNDYITSLGALGSYGLNSANTISGAGAKSSSSQQNGVFNSLFPNGLSDQRLKHKLLFLGQNEQGISVYRFEFLRQPDIQHVGVIAQNVRYKLPAAVDDSGKYLTVDYHMIKPLPDYPFTPPVTMEDLNG